MKNINWSQTFEEFLETSGLEREDARKQWNAMWKERLEHPEEYKNSN